MKVLISLLSLLTYSCFFGQDSHVIGQVVEANGKPLQDENVYIKSEKIGSQTNTEGLFEIDNLTSGSFNLEKLDTYNFKNHSKKLHFRGFF